MEQVATGKELKPGLCIGRRYTLLKKVGAGGMGEVWTARNEATRAEVALKVFRPISDLRDQAVERFRYEAHIGARLDHRNILRVYDFIEESDGTLALVMALLRGETLEERLSSGRPLEESEAVAITLSVLSGLEHAHDTGVVHRDLKPANIFLAVEPDGQVIPKLLDFGIAKAAASSVHTTDGLALGTPEYMSPEQIRRDVEVDARSDLFSLGTLLFQMLTGRSPFRRSTAHASLAAVLEAELDPEPAIGPQMWLVLQRALAKMPYERFVSAAEFATALRSLFQDDQGALVAALRRERPISVSQLEPSELQGISGPIVTVPPAHASDAVVLPRNVVPKKLLVIAAACGVLLVAFLGWATRTRSDQKSGEAAAASAAASIAAADAVASHPTAPPPVEATSTAPAVSAATAKTEKSAQVVPTGNAPRTRPAVNKKKPIATDPGF